MTTLPTKTVIQSIVTLLTEAYAGPPDPSATWFIDNEPEAGLLGLLKGVTAAEASTPMGGSRQPGATIAANVEHLRWSVANVNATIRGEPWNPNWAESWALIDLDEGQWEQLRESMRVEYETLVGLLGQQEELQGEYLLGTLAMLPHAAFHLGIIRQMVERVRQR